MAIRIRKIGDRTIAICAARSIPKEGDVYLDDAIHHALYEKFARDFKDEGIVDRAIDNTDLLLVEAEESNNKNREWWEQQYGKNRLL